MAKFTFIGDPNDPGDSTDACEMFGTVFPRGEPTEVADERLAAKLTGNKHFEGEVKKRRAKAAPESALTSEDES